MNAVVRTDKMFATDNRAGLVSVRYQPSDTMTAIDNGNVVKIGALEEGSREVYKGVTPAADDAIKDIVLIASPEVMYDERKRNLDEFINEAKGPAIRGYIPRSRNLIGFTKDGFVGGVVPAVDAEVGIGEGGKLDAAGTGFGICRHIEVVGRYTYYTIEIAKTEN